jgi:chromatin segregation and condensation protein Rec8/ScpA/Scc1 (kleisin family)
MLTCPQCRGSLKSYVGLCEDCTYNGGSAPPPTVEETATLIRAEEASRLARLRSEREAAERLRQLRAERQAERQARHAEQQRLQTERRLAALARRLERRRQREAARQLQEATRQEERRRLDETNSDAMRQAARSLWGMLPPRIIWSKFFYST